MKIKIFVLFMLAWFLFSCGRSAKETTEKAIFTNENVLIQGKPAGLSGHITKVYLSAFADFIGDFDLEQKIINSIRLNLEGYGLQMTGKIPNAQAIISGSMDSLIISSGRITNRDGLLYSIQLTYSINDKGKDYLQKDRQIIDHVLVLDTNSYQSNQVIEILVQNISKHTAESIFYGWQSEYSKTTNKIYTIGESIETNNSTNRAEPNKQTRIR